MVPTVKTITAYASSIRALCLNLNLSESNPESNPWCRSTGNPGHAAERINVVRIDRRQFGVRMLFPHHAEHHRLPVLADVDQYEVLTGHQVVVELGKLLVLAVDSHQAAFPGAEQRGRTDQDGVNER